MMKGAARASAKVTGTGGAAQSKQAAVSAHAPAPASATPPHHETAAQRAKLHQAAAKAAAARKRNAAKKRGWSPGTELPCCSAQAVGTLLGLSDADVLELFSQTPRDADGASILATLDALDQLKPLGCGGFHFRSPTWIADDGDLDIVEADIRQCAGALDGFGRDLDADLSVADGAGQRVGVEWLGHGLILGVELPGSHALAVTPDGTWWSWGQPFDPASWPGLVIEEAWAVRL